MAEQPTITPASSICATDGRFHCRVGAVVSDRDGRMLGLTARHVLFHMTDDRVLESASRIEVGRRVAWPTSEAGSRKFFDTIAGFELTTPSARMSPPSCQISEVASYENLVGTMVRKVDFLSGLEGTVVAIGGAVRFCDPYNRHTQVMQDVVEVRCRKPVPPAALIGQAGSLFVDNSSAAVGLLICGQGDQLFVAPLQLFMAAHKLTLAATGSDLAPQEMQVEIDAARVGARHLQHEVAGEPTMYKNSVGPEVPGHLLKLLHQE